MCFDVMQKILILSIWFGVLLVSVAACYVGSFGYTFINVIPWRIECGVIRCPTSIDADFNSTGWPWGSIVLCVYCLLHCSLIALVASGICFRDLFNFNISI